VSTSLGGCSGSHQMAVSRFTTTPHPPPDSQFPVDRGTMERSLLASGEVDVAVVDFSKRFLDRVRYHAEACQLCAEIENSPSVPVAVPFADCAPSCQTPVCSSRNVPDKGPHGVSFAIPCTARPLTRTVRESTSAVDRQPAFCPHNKASAYRKSLQENLSWDGTRAPLKPSKAIKVGLTFI